VIKMRKMKDSGIAWIGEIPEGWGIVLLSSIFKQRKEKNINNKENNLLSLSYGKIIRKDITLRDGLLPQSFETYNIIDNGDIVFRLTDLQNDKRSLRTGLCKEKGIITSAYVTIRPAVELSSDYMQYLYHSYDICKVFYGMGDGVRQGMNYDDLRRLPTLFPEYEEQQKIADFLDKKCAEIDKLIELQESMIEKLKEYKQSVITQAVTKGLDPDVPMKDSGIEWIGKIPEGWEVVRIKDIGTYRNGVIYSPEDLVDEENGTLVLRSSNIKDGKLVLEDNVYISATINNNLMVKKGDILICSRNGSKVLIGKNAIIDRHINAAFGAFMMIFRCKNPKYTYYILNSEVFAYYLGSYLTSTINQLTGKNFGNMQIIYANDIQTQQQIADYLDKKCAEIDDLIKLKEQKIEKLKEYKKSLIYEYVTGKKEVV